MALDLITMLKIRRKPIAVEILKDHYMTQLTGATPTYPRPKRDYKNPEIREACELLEDAGLLRVTYDAELLPESELDRLAELLGLEEERKAYLERERLRFEE